MHEETRFERDCSRSFRNSPRLTPRHIPSQHLQDLADVHAVAILLGIRIHERTVHFAAGNRGSNGERCVAGVGAFRSSGPTDLYMGETAISR